MFGEDGDIPYTTQSTTSSFSLQLITNMSDTKFLIHGRNNRTQMNQCLAYLYPTAEEAVAACQANHSDFVINKVTIDDTKP